VFDFHAPHKKRASSPKKWCYVGLQVLNGTRCATWREDDDIISLLTMLLAATHTPRPAPPLGPPLFLSFRLLCVSTSSGFLLKDSTRNRKSSLPNANILFHRAKSHSFFVARRPPLSSSVALVFSGPLAVGISPNAENCRRANETGMSVPSACL